MKIISHRGWWKTEREKNSRTAFERAVRNGFGVETDIRDYGGKLVISHDMPDGNEMNAAEFFSLDGLQNIPLALNIKADGLQNELKKLLEQHNINDYFVFDMSVPDTIGYTNLEMSITSRVSEYEKELPFYDSSSCVWLDCFNYDWFDADEIEKYSGKKICVVSPELHKRDYKSVWQMLKKVDSKNLMICTDLPQQAKEFFLMNRIKAVIFDMDGVLIDAKEWHYEALNRALRTHGHEISRYDHLTRFDGLPTSKKLNILSAERGLPVDLHKTINDQKQVFTMEIAEQKCKPLPCHQQALLKLKTEGYKLAMCSNSVRITIDMMIRKAEIDSYLDFSLSNQDVVNPKPDPEIYIKAINRLGLEPQECLIAEDNPNGIRAALASGAHLLQVKTVNDVNYKNIKERIMQVESLPVIENVVVINLAELQEAGAEK